MRNVLRGFGEDELLLFVTFVNFSQHKYPAIRRVAALSALALWLGHEHIVILCGHTFDLEMKGWRACVGHGDIQIQELLTSGYPKFHFAERSAKLALRLPHAPRILLF